MTDQIVIKEANAGKSIGLVALKEADGETTRYSELFITAQRKLSLSIIRGGLGGEGPSPTSTIDSFNLNSASMGNAITVGDKVNLVIEVGHTASNGGATITPIAYDANNVEYVLEPKTNEVNSTYPFYDNSNFYWGECQSWDVLGATEIKIHVSSIWGSANTLVVYGGVI